MHELNANTKNSSLHLPFFVLEGFFRKKLLGSPGFFRKKLQRIIGAKRQLF